MCSILTVFVGQKLSKIIISKLMQGVGLIEKSAMLVSDVQEVVSVFVDF